MKTIQPIPASESLEQPVDDGKTGYFVGDEYAVRDWRPGPPGSGPTTQVHLLIPIASDVQVVLRLKSARALDELVGVLLEYRREVWP